MIVYLHVGAPKTGTTYLQHLLRRNQRALADDGFCYPGNHRKAHFWAAQDLRETRFMGYPDPNVPGAWARLVEQIRHWEGPAAIIDHENLGRATADQVDRALADLAFAEVHLVYTVRDLARQLPAMWQESIKNLGTATFTDFLDSVRERGDDTSPGRHFWAAHDYAAVLERWSRQLPSERVHLITVPPPATPGSVLWERFATAVGLDPARYDQGDMRTNASLGTAETGALRRLNLAADGKDIDWPTYESSVKGLLSQRVLAGRSGRQKITLPAAEYPWVHAHMSKLVQDLADARYDVVGDLTDLIPAWPSETTPTGPSADGVPAEDQLEAAAQAMAGLLERVATLRGQVEATKERSSAHKRRADTLFARVSQVEAERDQAAARAKRAEAIVAEHRRLSPAERVRRTIVELESDVRAIRAGLALYRRLRALVGPARQRPFLR